MKVSQVINCSFSSWYPAFHDISIPSLVIPLPSEFIEYLNSEGVALPDSAVHDSGGAGYDSDDTNQVNWKTQDAARAEDATWISFDKTLKCTCPCDVYLLLKSSDFITHDLTEPFTHCEDCGTQDPIKYELVLRKWIDIQPGMEFRCFVRDNNLIAISQRHHTQFYEFIGKECKEIVTDIMFFYEENIKGKFLDESFVFDVYRKEKGMVILLDFNPFGHVTDSQLYKWKELTAETIPDSSDGPTEPDQPSFRYVQTKDCIQPSSYAGFGIPIDFMDLATGQDPSKLMDFLSLNNDSFQDYNYYGEEDDDDDSTNAT
ncbi:cell division cycle protein 123 homolog isoform X2 [Patella vulgata]|uniref:cell division cycle protein 123 homolog isoform X2 n=1 Tax=Patella vulgata TaxID=6465 RepID=UPI0024A84B20|nr:cell division cycle protein 123 homolog isoform X2 [Patella vulgata]